IGKVEVTAYVLIPQLAVGESYFELIEGIPKCRFPKILPVYVVTNRSRREKTKTVTVFKLGRTIVPAIKFKEILFFKIVRKATKISKRTPGIDGIGWPDNVPNGHIERVQVVSYHIPFGSQDPEAIVFFLLISDQ